MERFAEYLGKDKRLSSKGTFTYVEPTSRRDKKILRTMDQLLRDPFQVVEGRVQRLGDFVDTDALVPAEYLTTAHTFEAMGEGCLKYANPGFRARAASGFNIVVAGTAFGCGSSREMAVLALKGCGISCVIAKSYSFIFDRNQYALGLLGITLSDDSFYASIKDGTHISIDVVESVVTVKDKKFPFRLNEMERALIEVGGITSTFKKFGKQLFDNLRPPRVQSKADIRENSVCGDHQLYTNW